MKSLLTLVIALASVHATAAINCQPAGTDMVSVSSLEGPGGQVVSLTVSSPMLPAPLEIRSENGGSLRVDREVSESAEKTVYMGSQGGSLATLIMEDPIQPGKTSPATIYLSVGNQIVEAQLSCGDDGAE